MRGLALVLVWVLGAAACSGGGGGGGGGGSGGGAPSQDGIGGVATGVITGFGSVILNDQRRFLINGNTRITVDGGARSEDQLRAEGLGLVSRVVVRDDANADLTAGTAAEIEAINVVRGPVTATRPLQVLGQEVVVTGDTVLVDVADPAILAPGDVVEVSGFRTTGNVILATRLRFAAGGLMEWSLLGPVQDVAADAGFAIGRQAVVLNGVVPGQCPSGLADGQLVQVQAAPVPDFAGGPLASVLAVSCRAEDFSPPVADIDDNLSRVIAGFITAVVGVDVIVSGQAVRPAGNTVLAGGGREDLVVNALVEAEGALDPDSDVLLAERITFPLPRFRVEAPLAPAAVTAGSGLEILGIDVMTSALTDDADGVANGGLAGERQVDVRGFTDRTGRAFATQVRDRGNPDGLLLRGPARDIVPNASFTILGITIDAPSTIAVEDAGSSITLAEFFARLTDGTQVQIQNGVFDPATRTIASTRLATGR